MSHEELQALLLKARAVLERYLVDDESEVMCDDIAEICMAIDDAFPREARVALKKAELEPAPRRSAA